MSHEEGKSKARQGASQRSVTPELPASWAETWVHRERRRARVDTSAAKGCAKCGRSDRPVYRHHKGFDSLLGWFNKAIGYGYYKWLDCVPLCEDCHCDIHFIYEPLVEKWINRSTKGARIFRTYLVGVCDDWLAGRVKTPSVPKVYRQRFHQSLLDWQRRKK